MKKANIIYEENNTLLVKYYKPKFREYLEYDTNIRIKDSGKNPIEIALSFYGTPPDIGIMPPEEHIIRAPSILELQRKIVRWFKKYGYILT
jgi:hypothetical protein